MDFNNLKVSDFMELVDTPEGKIQIESALKENNPEQLAKIGRGVISLYRMLSKAGNAVLDNLEEIQKYSDFVERITALPESDAMAELEKIFDTVYNGVEIKETEKAEIIEQWYRKPESFTQPLTKAVEKIFDGKTDFSEPTGLKVGTSKKLPAIINAQLFVSVLDADGALLPKCLTPYDREVFNGICSILASGQRTMTSRQIYEAMAGKSITTPQALGAVTKSIRKMQTTLLNIDWTEHARMKGIDMGEGDFIKTEEPILPARGAYIKAGGQVRSGYTLYTEPALFTYAKAVGQISTTDKKVLQIPTVSNTEETIVLKNFLMRHVEHLKNSKKWNPVLTFETIFENCGIDVPANHATRKRKVIFDILDYWKSIGYISTYEVNKQGRSYHSITIKI